MERELTFKEAGGRHEVSFVSEGPGIVQVRRAGFGTLEVKCGIGDMEPVGWLSWGEYNGRANLLFPLDMPAGVSVTIVSGTEVLEAKYLRAVTADLPDRLLAEDGGGIRAEDGGLLLPE